MNNIFRTCRIFLALLIGSAQRSRMAPYFTGGCTFRAIRLVTILVTICLAFGVRASAQFDTGTIAGRITDPSGAVIPQATVTISNVDTSIQTTVQSDSGGSYVASGLPFGHYVVSATASSFGTATTKPLVLTVGATVRVNLALTVATGNVTVQVTGTTTSVDTSSSTAGTTLSSNQVANLPINGRDVSDFLEISPGSVGSTSYFQGSVNGLDNIFTGLNITLDGQAANRGDVNGFLDDRRSGRSTRHTGERGQHPGDRLREQRLQRPKRLFSRPADEHHHQGWNQRLPWHVV